MASPSAKYCIHPANADQVPEALDLFHSTGRKADWDKLFALILEDDLPDGGLLIAEQDGILVGAILARRLSKTSAEIVAPASSEDVSVRIKTSIETDLIRAAVELLAADEVEFVTCVVGTSDRYDEPLSDSGFKLA
ncbi:MAG: hypothetical protein KDB27_23810, partial [Planctomycetales bacterium]|nr:hypothetical protein [Planctomycetales bacterium]